MDKARQIIAEELAAASSPVVLSSFGKDSVLLLMLIREIANVPVIWFRTGSDETFAKAMIRGLDLTVFSYPPADVYPLQDANNLTLIHEYSFGPDRLPVVVDIVSGTKCSLDHNTKRLPTMYQPWDVVFTGYKDSDTHWLKGPNELFRNVRLGLARVVTPLQHLTDAQVIEELEACGIDYDRSDELSLCTACYSSTAETVHCPKLNEALPVHRWDHTAALNAFRTRFNLGA